MAEFYPSSAQELTLFFNLNWGIYSDFLTFKGRLNPVTDGLWLSDTAYRHLVIAVLFIIAVFAFSLMFLFSGRGYWQEGNRHHLGVFPGNKAYQKEKEQTKVACKSP